MTKYASYFEIHNLLNLTTEMKMLKKIDEGRTEAMECANDSFAFLCGPATCRTGQLVKVEGTLHILGKNVEFECFGKVTAALVLEDPTFSPGLMPSEAFDSELTGLSRLSGMKVTVHLTQYDRTQWEAFIGAIAERQRHVDQLFLALRDEV